MASHYQHLSFEERRKIAKWREGKMPVPEIADRLSRPASTIYRELKRNTFLDAELPQYSGYYAVTAQDKYERRRAVHRKLVAHPGGEGSGRGCAQGGLVSGTDCWPNEA